MTTPRPSGKSSGRIERPMSPPAPYMPPELHERDVERRLHQAPLGLGEEGLRGGDVLGRAVVRGDGDRALRPVELGPEDVRNRLDHERLHHRAAVAEDVAPEG